ncbi:alpha/beta hydrolase family esterase [Micromonospora sp. NPDC093243]
MNFSALPSGHLKRLITITAFALVIALGGCIGSNPPPAGEVPTTTGSGLIEHTIIVDGNQRQYHLYRPSSVPPDKPIPLVVMLHGASGTGEQAATSYGWMSQADRGGFLVAFPSGLKRSWAITGDCCGPSATEGVDDVGFVVATVESITQAQRVDSDRIYVSGISNGGMLAYRLACETSTFAAVGVVSGTMLGPCPSPQPVSVIHVHGTADTTLPYAGGPGRRDNQGRGARPVDAAGPPIPELNEFWRRAESCGPSQTTGGDPVRIISAQCPMGRSVELLSIEGAGHGWPGSEVSDRAARLLHLDPPSTAMNATQVLWEFFEAHPAGTAASSEARTLPTSTDSPQDAPTARPPG